MRDLLINAPANTVGQWVRVEPAGKKTWPFRLVVTGTFTAGSVIIEELIGGLPTSPGPLAGNPGLLTANSQTGTVQQIAQLAGPGDFVIEAPTEFIRARTDANIAGGTASARLQEAE